MARKKRNEEHENHERWLVSYADFITLLFAFFVVMYSISSVNEGKYRVLSDSMVAAFRDPARSLEPIQVGQLVRAPLQSEEPLDRNKPVIEIIKIPVPRVPIEAPWKEKAQEQAGPDTGRQAEPHQAEDNEVDETTRELADSIEEAMTELVDDGLIDVRRDKRWIEVEINSKILFASGSAELADSSLPILRQLAEKLRSLNNVIHVEGFTDNIPINNFEFISNWELSAARAASVVHLFSRFGIDPGRMAAIGYGEYRPVESNDTAAGRARNRRVVLVIMSGTDARVSQRLDHLQTLREGRPTPAQPVAVRPLESSRPIQSVSVRSAGAAP
jgi:chemotaxis protein MotB